MSALCQKQTHALRQLRPLLLQEIANFRQQLAWARTAPISRRLRKRSTESYCGITTTFRNDTITKCAPRDGIVSASRIRCRKHQCVTDRYRYLYRYRTRRDRHQFQTSAV